jgi:hypothetical protein
LDVKPRKLLGATLQWPTAVGSEHGSQLQWL